VYCTHSPYAVSLEHFESVRRIQKATSQIGPMETHVKRATLQEVSSEVLKSYESDQEPTKDSSYARIRSVVGITAVDAIFARATVLVECDEDAAIIVALAEHKSVSFDRAGVAVLAAGGKTKLPPLFALFGLLEIGRYILFDLDMDSSPDDRHDTTNKALLRLMDSPVDTEDNIIGTFGAAWKTDLVTEVRKEVGAPVWEDAFKEAGKRYEIKAKDGEKKFAIVRETTRIMLTTHTVPLLEELWASLSTVFLLTK